MEKYIGSTVIEIIHENSDYPELDGFVMLNDGYIGEDDEFLIDSNKDEYKVLEHVELDGSEVTLILDEFSPHLKINRGQTFTFVKLNKQISIGMTLQPK